MATKYEKQIEKLLAHVKKLHQLIEERTQQLQYWQGYSKKLREERLKLQQNMLMGVRAALGEVVSRFHELKEENKRLRAAAEHQAQLNELSQQNLKNQLKYALMRIDELAAERKSWRLELQSRQQSLMAMEQRVGQLEAQLRGQTDQFQKTEERSRDFERQIELQQQQWQDLVAQRDTLTAQLEAAEAELAATQKKLKKTADRKENSVEREMSHMRDLVARLQQQTEDLQQEIATSHETISEQERFIALLRDGKPVNFKSVRRQKENEEKENQRENG
jgi:chromosome segregation ATPase